MLDTESRQARLVLLPLQLEEPALILLLWLKKDENFQESLFKVFSPTFVWMKTGIQSMRGWVRRWISAREVS